MGVHQTDKRSRQDDSTVCIIGSFGITHTSKDRKRLYFVSLFLVRRDHVLSEQLKDTSRRQRQ